ncbi:MAG: Lrp/AsnC family transcriptional regulator [Fusobacteriaceae bacterium]
MEVDKTDIEILSLLEENSRITLSEISKKIFLSIPAISERIRKMEEKNIIEKYTLKVSRKNLGFKLLAVIFVNIDHSDNIENFRREVIGFPEVIQCLHTAGSYDYLLNVLVRDTEELEGFLSVKLKKIKGILKTNTIISLSTLKDISNRLDI